MPPHAPERFKDRETLWNEVEKIEKHPKAQLAYSFDIALQNEFTREENMALVRQFLQDEFVGRGMIADFAIHEKDAGENGNPNPHFHVMCPIRPLNPDGSSMVTASRTAKAIMNSMPSPRLIGAVPKGWRHGERHGQIAAMRSLKKSNWP